MMMINLKSLSLIQNNQMVISYHYCSPPIIRQKKLPTICPNYVTLISTNNRQITVCCSSADAAGDQQHFSPEESDKQDQASVKKLWTKWMTDTAAMRARVAKLGLAAVLAYGLFDGLTYTTFFVLAFLGYEKSTGKNPAANLQALVGIVVLMWTGNNITRPFRVAGAAALAPAIDKGLKQIQKNFNLPSLIYAFALAVGIVAMLCLSVVGLLILSRLGK